VVALTSVLARIYVNNSSLVTSVAEDNRLCAVKVSATAGTFVAVNSLYG
jgi:hypothetical protein